MQVIAHGGAGPAPDEATERRRVLREAVTDGEAADDPLDAVARTVRRLESSPAFNAGVGGAVQSDGVVRTDAGVMAADGTAGAACSMPGVGHAVDVARAVAVETPHVLLAGDRAVAFAEAVGVDVDRDLLTERTRERRDEADAPDALADQVDWVRDRFGERDEAGADTGDGSGADTGTDTDDDAGDGNHTDHDTVGAVATDGDALAAATSTGGRWYALAGRVGDVPQIGAGFYADERGGASATGAGEAIARFGLARRAVELLGGRSPRQAAEEAIDEFDDATGAGAGVILADPAGHVGSAFNTASMETARTERE